MPVVRDNHLHLILATLRYDNGQTVVVEGDIHGDDLVALNAGQAAEDNEVLHSLMQQQ